MFIKKDTRKIQEILQEDEEELRVLKLARRRFEFKGGNVNVLFQSKQVPKLKASQYLSLYGNELHSIKGIDCLSGGNIRELNLGNNFLKELPLELSLLKSSLKVLWLDDNLLEVFPQALLDLDNLTSLRLSRNNIKHVPAQIRMLKQLEELSIDNNGVEFLPDTINELTCLRILNARQNKLTEVPDISQLAALETLAISSNHLTSAPTGMGNLNSLKFLYLNGNKISSFPMESIDLPNLVHLNISNNKLDDIPEEVTTKWGELNEETGKLQSSEVVVLMGGNPCTVKPSATPKKA